ncbi:STAS domain-containing protein [Propionivibrio sp.]|uniref:STAS domain-containing protein n=1 Tax=Propionivibrio sp. TaxID=2212460 RepID=UPI003BEFDA2F
MTNFRETVRGDCLVIELEGKLDASTTPEILARLLEKIHSGQKYLALDFGAVSYMASSGLRMLLVLAATTSELEGRLVLCGLDKTILDTLDVVGFLPNFQVVADRDAALACLEK